MRVREVGWVGGGCGRAWPGVMHAGSVVIMSSWLVIGVCCVVVESGDLVVTRCGQ